MRLFNAAIVVVTLAAAVCVSAREFRWIDIVEHRESLQNYQNGDEIVLRMGANPPVTLGPEITATRIIVRGPSLHYTASTWTPYVIFNTSINIEKVTFKWINFTGSSPRATFDASHSESSVLGLFIESCVLFGSKHVDLLHLEEYHGNVSITNSQIIGYKSVLSSPVEHHTFAKTRSVVVSGNSISWRGGDFVALFTQDSNSTFEFSNNTMTWVKSIPSDNPTVAISSKLLVGYAATVDVKMNRVTKVIPSEETLADFQIDFNQLISSLSVTDNDFTDLSSIELASNPSTSSCFPSTFARNRFSRSSINAVTPKPFLKFLCDAKTTGSVSYTYNWWGDASGPAANQISAGESGNGLVPSAFPWYADADFKHVAIRCGTCVFNNRCDFVTGQCSLTNETVTAIVVTVIVTVVVLIGVFVCIYRKFCRSKDEYDAVEEEDESERGLLSPAAGYSS